MQNPGPRQPNQYEWDILHMPRQIGVHTHLRCVCVLHINPFRLGLESPFRGQFTEISSSLSPKRDCGSKRVKPFFLPVDIQHNQSPCRFFNRRELQVTMVCRHKTTPQRYHVLYAVSTVDNAMSCTSYYYGGP